MWCNRYDSIFLYSLWSFCENGFRGCIRLNIIFLIILSLIDKRANYTLQSNLSIPSVQKRSAISGKTRRNSIAHPYIIIMGFEGRTLRKIITLWEEGECALGKHIQFHLDERLWYPMGILRFMAVSWNLAEKFEFSWLMQRLLAERC